MEKDMAYRGRSPVSPSHERYRSFLRFIVVGLVNTGVDYLFFLLLVRVFGVNYLVAQAASYSMGIVNSFFMNKAWTFDHAGSETKTGTQFARFLALNLLFLGISLIGLEAFNRLGANIYAAKIMVTGVIWFVRYLVYKYWVFGGGGSGERGLGRLKESGLTN